MSGFAADYHEPARHPPYKGDSPAVVMAYHTAKQLPVYAYLAEEFCVCDHWFCSVPGETMPNRCYAVAGSSGGQIDAIRPPQPYNLKSFCRHLDDVEGLLALVLARLRADALADRLRVRPLGRGDTRLLRPQGRLRAPQLPRARRRRRPARRLLDRPELHRPHLRASRLKRRPPTLRPPRRPEAGARTVRRGHAEPSLGEDAAGDHLRRARRLLRPRPAAAGRRRHAEHPPTRPTRTGTRHLALGGDSARSQRPCSITHRSSRRSSPASAANPTAPSPTWAPASAPPNTSANCSPRAPPGQRPRGQRLPAR